MNKRDQLLPLVAQYGVPWNDDLKSYADKNLDQVENNLMDTSMTGLHAFMLAACGSRSDLNAIVGLMKMDLGSVRLFNTSSTAKRRRLH